MPKIKANGITLNYEIRGKGPRLLFIHGIGAGLGNPMVLFNAPLAGKYTILAFDPRGLGGSGSVEEPYTVADMADDAAALVKAVGWDRCLVFGASMGGMVAQELVLRHPEIVEKIVFAVTNAGNIPLKLKEMDSMTTEELLSLSDSRQDAAWAKENPELVRRFEERFRAAQTERNADPAQLKGYNLQVQAASGHNAYERLNEIQAPALVVGGRYDSSNPPDATADFAAHIPNSHYLLVDSGHGSWFFDEAVWAAVEDFYAG
jgi:3-oxoadipate enol-lactonase